MVCPQNGTAVLTGVRNCSPVLGTKHLELRQVQTQASVCTAAVWYQKGQAENNLSAVQQFRDRLTAIYYQVGFSAEHSAVPGAYTLDSAHFSLLDRYLLTSLPSSERHPFISAKSEGDCLVGQIYATAGYHVSHSVPCSTNTTNKRLAPISSVASVLRV